MPEIDKNGTPGKLIHSKVRLIPLGPAGPFVLQGFMIEMDADGPNPVGHMEFQADSLALLEHGFRGLQQAYAAAMKQMIDEFNAAKLMTQHDASTVARINKSKGGS